MYEIRAAMPPWGETVDLLIIERQYRRTQNDPRRVVTALTVADVGIHDFVEPSLRLDRDMAQQLMDNLWQCGLRPTEGTGSAGSLKATEKHLEDMRRLVFDSTKGDQ